MKLRDSDFIPALSLYIGFILDFFCIQVRHFHSLSVHLKGVTAHMADGHSKR